MYIPDYFNTIYTLNIPHNCISNHHPPSTPRAKIFFRTHTFHSGMTSHVKFFSYPTLTLKFNCRDFNCLLFKNFTHFFRKFVVGHPTVNSLLRENFLSPSPDLTSGWPPKFPNTPHNLSTQTTQHTVQIAPASPREGAWGLSLIHIWRCRRRG